MHTQITSIYNSNSKLINNLLDIKLYFSSITIADIFSIPVKDTLILTINERYSKWIVFSLIKNFQFQFKKKTLPKIFPLFEWIRYCTNELEFQQINTCISNYQLNEFSSKLVWNEAIKQDMSNKEILNVDQLVDLALEADFLMHEWQIFVPQHLETPEYQAFSRWRYYYDHKLKIIDAEDFNRIYKKFILALRKKKLHIQKNIVLVGFDEISPRLRNLLESLLKMSSSIFKLEIERKNQGIVQYYEAINTSSEWYSAANWAAECLSSNPNGHYAIISTDLKNNIPIAQRMLNKCFIEHYGDLSAIPFNISIGRSLIQWPVIQSALYWLHALSKTAEGSCSAEIYGKALLSGYCIGDIQYATDYISIDIRWRQQARIKIDPTEWINSLRECKQLKKGWNKALLAWNQMNFAKSDKWMKIMKDSLFFLGFPGEHKLDEITYQVINALEESFNNFAAIAPVVGPISGIDAVHLLNKLIESTKFQTQKDPSLNLDILDVKEAEIGNWDSIWFLGMNDGILPAQIESNPLLPWLSLKEIGISSRATSEHEFQWSSDIYNKICRSASKIIVSYARANSERELYPSFLIKEDAQSLLKVFNQTDPLLIDQEIINDSKGPILSESSKINGGLDVLELQARNPLWAFLRYRLGAVIMPHYSILPGINLRGKFLHKILELVWKNLKNYKALSNMVEEHKLEFFLKKCINEAAVIELKTYSEILSKLECERAYKMLIDWFSIELQRSPFTVKYIEKSCLWKYGPLTLRFRTDRIDLLENDHIIIIDYKTGNTAMQLKLDWSRTRPINIQLPFYAITTLNKSLIKNIAALVMIHIHTKSISIQGIVNQELDFTELMPFSENYFSETDGWNETMKKWSIYIHGLADEFIEGIAINRTYKYDDLKFCDALPFLRIFPNKKSFN